MPTGNTTSSPLCINTSERSGDALERAHQIGKGLPGDRPAQSTTCAGIHLSRALGSLIFLPQHSTPCHSDKAALWGYFACSGHSWVEASALAAFTAHQEHCDICSVLPMGALPAPPTSFTHRYTHFKLSSVFRESRKYLLKIFMQKLFMAWPTSTPWQPLHNTAQRSPYLEEHTAHFAVHKSPRSNSSGFSIKSGT